MFIFGLLSLQYCYKNCCTQMSTLGMSISNCSFFRFVVMDRGFDSISTSAFYGRKKLPNLVAAADFAVSCASNNVDVVILPPNPDPLTDEEDLDEDNLDSDNLPRDVPGNLEVFVHPSGNETDILVSSDSEWDDSDNETLNVKKIKLSSIHTKSKKTQKKKDPNFFLPDWKKGDGNYSHWQAISTGATDRAERIIEELKSLSPIAIFEKLVDKQLMQHIVDQSILYARQKNNHTFSLTIEELKNFFGILFLTGYHRLPRERLYWSLDEDLHVEIVSQCMARNRYLDIKKYLHVNDNTQINDDRMYKVRPLMDKLNANFQQWGIFHKALSVDEAMVKYYGHHPAKQFIRGKPCRFGFKNWSLCSSNGYCYALDTYCGKTKTDNDNIQLPLGSKVVLSLLQCIDVPNDHIVFFDNYFTSLPLLSNLRAQGFRASGTLRQNRTEKCPLSTVKEMEKKKRATYETSFDAKNEILLVRWYDNSVCTMATNYDTVAPLQKVRRWCKTKKEKTDMEQPNVFRSYNQGMGGVDSNDQSVNNYRIAIRGKKWYWALITHMLNVALVNAWRLHQLVSDNKMDLLLFIRNITRYYLRLSPKGTGKLRNSASVSHDIVQDARGHYPLKIPNQLRCRICHSRVRWQCKKCVVTLCVEKQCFENFHTN